MTHSQASNAARPVATGQSALVVLLLVLVGFGVAQRGAAIPARPPEARADVPDLEKVQDVSQRKQRFFDFLRPIVAAENARILAQRERILRLLATLESGAAIGDADRRWLAEMAQRYRVKADEALAQARRLAHKVDEIPASLALAQAALESAWGTSRFAREANNLFGEWCFTPGCGLIPKRRPADARYEVEKFVDVGASVRSYMHNLNSHPAYKPLREIRARARANGEQPTGTALAAGLTNYAAIGQKYVEHIRGVIRRNGLGGVQPG